MRHCRTLFVISILATALSAFGQGAAEGSVSSAPNDRKLIYRIDPVYPQDLKRFYIGGTVRLKLLVSARGTVESVAPLGGNPALVETSIAAVKKWKYAPASAATEVTLSLVFTPHN